MSYDLGSFHYGATRTGSRFRDKRAFDEATSDSDTSDVSVSMGKFGYPANMSDLLEVLQTSIGLKIFKRAYRLNMLYKAEKYKSLRRQAEELVKQHKEVIDIKMPLLKRAAGLDTKETGDNWHIFESISQEFKEATAGASLFEKIETDANDRLSGSMSFDEVKPNDIIYLHRDKLVEALRALGNFSTQAHIISKVVDIVTSFLKDPRLFRQKMMNFMLLGGAGTGKSTVAEAIGRVFARAGIFVGDKLIEAGRAELVGQYEGQTVARTRSFLVNNLDAGVIFIDEAYAITPWHNGKPEGYGSEAANAMVEFMTKYTGLYCIIVAGYEKEMTRYFLPTNEGMSRRFPNKLKLANFDTEGLLLVFRRKLLEYQGLELPKGNDTRLESEDYFTLDAWAYLRSLLHYSLQGVVEYDEEEDSSTKMIYRNVRTFVPQWTFLYQLFEHQAGSMANLADEAVLTLFATMTFEDMYMTLHKMDTRPTIRQQNKSVMRDIIVQRILNTALSESEHFLMQLEQGEQLFCPMIDAPGPPPPSSPPHRPPATSVVLQTGGVPPKGP